MKKKIYKNSENDFHFGVNAPEGYSEGHMEDLKRHLENLGNKKIWRCNVCNDLQISLSPLEVCPTCFVKDAYVEIDLNEFTKLINIL